MLVEERADVEPSEVFDISEIASFDEGLGLVDEIGGIFHALGIGYGDAEFLAGVHEHGVVERDDVEAAFRRVVLFGNEERAFGKHGSCRRVFTFDNLDFDLGVAGLFDGYGGIDLRDVEAFGGSCEAGGGYIFGRQRVRTVVIGVGRALRRGIVEGVAVVNVGGDVVGAGRAFSGFHRGAQRRGNVDGAHELHFRCAADAAHRVYAGITSLRGLFADACRVDIHRIVEAVFAAVAESDGLGRDMVVGGCPDVDLFLVESHRRSGGHDEFHGNDGLLDVVFAGVDVAGGVVERQVDVVFARCHPLLAFHHRHGELQRGAPDGEGGHAVVHLPLVVAGRLAGYPVDFGAVDQELEQLGVFVEPFVVDARAVDGYREDSEGRCSVVAHFERCVVAGAHADDRIRLVGRAVAVGVFDVYSRREFGGGLAGDGEGHGNLYRFARGNVRGHAEGGLIESGHAVGVESEADVVFGSGSEGERCHGGEAHAVAEVYHAVGQTDIVGAAFTRDACQAERAHELGVLVGCLVAEAESSVGVENELEADADVHRVAVFHERHYGAVVGHIVVCSGRLGLVHGVESPVGSDDVAEERALREVGRRFGPEAVVVALGERDEAGVVDIHLPVFLAVEREFERKIDGNIVVVDIVGQGVVLAEAVGLDVDPFDGGRGVVDGGSVGVGHFRVGALWHCQRSYRVGSQGVGEFLVACVLDSEGLLQRFAAGHGLVDLVETHCYLRAADDCAVDRDLEVAGCCRYLKQIAEVALLVGWHGDDEVFRHSGIDDQRQCGADGHSGAGERGAGDGHGVAAGVLDADRHADVGGAEHASEVDVGIVDSRHAAKALSVDDGVDAHCREGRRRVGSDDGQVVECRASIEVAAGAQSGVDLHALAGGDNAGRSRQGGHEGGFRRLELHSSAGAEFPEAAVLGRGLFRAPVVGDISAGHCQRVGDGGVVDAAEEARAALEHIVGIIVVVEHLDVAVGRQGDMERYGNIVAGIDRGQDVDELDDELTVLSGIDHLRTGVHHQLRAVGADKAGAFYRR